MSRVDEAFEDWSGWDAREVGKGADYQAGCLDGWRYCAAWMAEEAAKVADGHARTAGPPMTPSGTAAMIAAAIRALVKE